MKVLKLRVSIPVLLLGLLLLGVAGFAGDCGKTPTPCPNPPCTAPTPDPAAQKAKALKYARAIANSFRIIEPLIVKDKPEEKAKLDHLIASADQVIAAVDASNNTELVKLLADIMPAFTSIVDEYTDNTAVQIALVIADEALQFFADEFVAAAPAEVAAGRPVTAALSSQAHAILKFRDGSHLRFRDKKSGRFVASDYAQAHESEVYVEKTKPKQ